MNGYRYPIGDLFAMMRSSDDDCRRQLALSGSSYGLAVQWGLTFDQAERYAERAGFHPYEVWPQMRDDAIADATGTRVQVLQAFVCCLSCGRPLEFGEPKVSSSGASGHAEATCPVGHRNTLKVELEVA